jgi:hypothetical protein
MLDDSADLPREGEDDVGGAVEGHDLPAEDELFEPGPKIGRPLEHLVAMLIDADRRQIGISSAACGTEGDPGEPLRIDEISSDARLPVAIEKDARVAATVVDIVAGIAAGRRRDDDEAPDQGAGLVGKAVEGLGPGPEVGGIGRVEQGDPDAGLGEVEGEHPRMPLDAAEPVGIDAVGEEGDMEGTLGRSR